MSERKVKLPGFPAVTEANLAQVVRLLVERAEVREGARGSDLEAVVTKRDLVGMGLPVSGYPARAGFGQSGGASGGVLTQSPSGALTTVSMDAFGERLRNTKLYSSLVQRLDDVSRFDEVPEKVQALLLASLADEAALRGADVQRLDYKLQSATESLAYTVQTVTAAVANASAGVREVTYASATANRATAGKVTQIQARLDGVGGVTIEQSMKATADRVAGLSGEVMIKVNAGGAVAGIGLSASEDPQGNTKSSFIVQAGDFGLIGTVTFTQAATPTAASIGQTWYNITSKLYYRATATGAASWVAFTPVVPFGVDTVTNTTFINGNLRVNAGGATLADSMGRYTDYVFRRSATVPATPTGDNPTGWFDTPPTGTDPLYMAVADKTAAGVLIGVWSAATRLDGAAGTAGANGGVGATGADGITTYTWIAYANNSTGSSGFTTGAWSGHTYIGLATNKTTSVESTTPGDYTWSLIKGEQGVTGAAGAAGTNGANGTNGTNGAAGVTGTRGTIVTKISGGYDVNAAAAAITTIANATGATPNYPIKGDIVYYNGGAMECTAAGYPGTWGSVAAYIDGSMVITGTLAASKISAGTMSSGEFRVSGYNGHSKFNSLGTPAQMVERTSNTLEVLSVFETISGSTETLAKIATGPGSTAIALEVTGQSGGGAAKFFSGTTKEFWAAPGAFSAYAPSGKGKFYPVDGTGPFTGFHDALLPRDVVYEIGDIVVDTAIVLKPDINNTLSTVALSSAPNQKTAIGILSAVREIDEFLTLPYEAWWAYVSSHRLAEVNAVGEGQINVCGLGGNLEAGDLIVTSTVHGKGTRQGDDLIRNTTVAKCREAVKFATPGEIHQVACIYLCG